jgi:hypothetical protein
MFCSLDSSGEVEYPADIEMEVIRRLLALTFSADFFLRRRGSRVVYGLGPFPSQRECGRSHGLWADLD